MKHGFKIVTRIVHCLSSSMLVVAGTSSLSQPLLVVQPTNQSVSLGASASFQVAAVTTNPPLGYQWRFASTNLASATSATLLLTNIQMVNKGEYDVLVTDAFGSITSLVASLNVDPTFTKITSGQIVNDAGVWAACAWGDYDDDGFVDLFVGSPATLSGSFQRNALYHNNGDGTFARITTNAIVTEAGNWRGCAWADYDEDGHLDLFITSVEGYRVPRPGFSISQQWQQHLHKDDTGSAGKLSPRRILGGMRLVRLRPRRLSRSLRCQERWHGLALAQ